YVFNRNNDESAIELVHTLPLEKDFVSTLDFGRIKIFAMSEDIIQTRETSFKREKTDNGTLPNGSLMFEDSSLFNSTEDDEIRVIFDAGPNGFAEHTIPYPIICKLKITFVDGYDKPNI